MVNNSDRYGRLFSAIATPLAPEGGVEHKVLRTLASYQLQRGVEGFYCNGSSGEGYLLSSPERQAVLETVLAEAGDDVPVISHVGALSTAETIALARHAAKAGATAISVTPPIYYKYSDVEVREHFQAVLDAVEIPLIVYNIPQFTGRSLSSEDPLLNDPRVVGVKHTAHNMFELERMRTLHPNLAVINGFDETFLPAISAGAIGAIGTTIGMQIGLFKAIRALHFAGKTEDARRFQSLVGWTIAELVAVNVFPAAKWVESQLTGLQLGPCRPPFAPVPGEAQARLRKVVQHIKRSCAEANEVLTKMVLPGAAVRPCADRSR